MAQVLKTPTQDSDEYVEQSTASLQSAITFHWPMCLTHNAVEKAIT